MRLKGRPLEVLAMGGSDGAFEEREGSVERSIGRNVRGIVGGMELEGPRALSEVANSWAASRAGDGAAPESAAAKLKDGVGGLALVASWPPLQPKNGKEPTNDPEVRLKGVWAGGAGGGEETDGGGGEADFAGGERRRGVASGIRGELGTSRGSPAG